MTVVVKSFSKFYGSQKAVDSASFTLNKGEITGFIGPNGSGKSTTMKAICGLLEPDEGTIEIIEDSTPDKQVLDEKNIGFLPESNPLYYDLYIKEYLLNVARMYKVKNPSARVEEIMKLTGLDSEKKKKIGQLSKGYKQRVGIAQALVHDPEILILDEPTTGLDPNQLVEVRALIKKISKNKTVLLSTHILQEVEAICDRVLMIHNGKIVKDASTSEILKQDNASSVIVEFKNPVTDSELKNIKGLINFRKVENKWLIEGRSDVDIRDSIFDFAQESNNRILELQTKNKRLEEVFKEYSSKT
ncbi:MAG: ATP-binding cassette domain-containing protein [Bacteroidales bacterium]|nr:ATP-binding cassette domain-containing protein [Bacteroidales bacterium]MBN2820605.1 ATP-binding cassette domain-containing protein [Bacteroidales bacterium]